MCTHTHTHLYAHRHTCVHAQVCAQRHMCVHAHVYAHRHTFGGQRTTCRIWFSLLTMCDLRIKVRSADLVVGVSIPWVIFASPTKNILMHITIWLSFKTIFISVIVSIETIYFSILNYIFFSARLSPLSTLEPLPWSPCPNLLRRSIKAVLSCNDRSRFTGYMSKFHKVTYTQITNRIQDRTSFFS